MMVMNQVVNYWAALELFEQLLPHIAALLALLSVIVAVVWCCVSSTENEGQIDMWPNPMYDDNDEDEIEGGGINSGTAAPVSARGRSRARLTHVPAGAAEPGPRRGARPAAGPSATQLPSEFVSTRRPGRRLGNRTVAGASPTQQTSRLANNQQNAGPQPGPVTNPQVNGLRMQANRAQANMEPDLQPVVLVQRFDHEWNVDLPRQESEVLLRRSLRERKAPRRYSDIQWASK